MTNFTDRPEIPHVGESEKKIRRDAKDALKYLRRVDALDLIPILGIEVENEDAERESA